MCVCDMYQNLNLTCSNSTQKIKHELITPVKNPFLLFGQIQLTPPNKSNLICKFLSSGGMAIPVEGSTYTTGHLPVNGKPEKIGKWMNYADTLGLPLRMIQEASQGRRSN